MPLDPVKALAALANPFRWQFVRLMADGSEWSASAVADRFGRDFDGVSKHLRRLRSAGILSSRRGQDRRTELFFLPSPFRSREGELDFGFAVLRLPEARPDDSPPHPEAIPQIDTGVPLPETCPPPMVKALPATRLSPPAPAIPHPLAGVRFFSGEPEEEDAIETPEEPPPCGFGEMINQQQPFRFR